MAGRTFPQTPERVIASELAVRLGDTVRCKRIATYLGRNEVFAVNDDLILKIFHIEPLRRQRTETNSLAFLNASGVRAPRYVAHGEHEDGFVWLLQTRLAGTPLSQQTLVDTAGELGVYQEIGRLLARLHDLSATAPPELASQTLAERWVHTRKRLDGKSVLEEDIVRRAVAHLDRADLTANQYPPVFVHNDFSARNFLVTGGEKGGALEFSGLIDFEKSFLGDVWADLAILVFKTFAATPLLFRAFCSGYGRDHAADLVAHPHLVNRSLIEMLYIASWAASDDPDFCATALAHTAGLLSGEIPRLLQSSIQQASRQRDFS